MEFRMIVCCGEALIDMIPEKISNCRNVFVPTVGGAVFNTTIALGRLNNPVSFFSGISNDLFGKYLIEELSNSRVDLSRIVHSDQPTTLAFVELKQGNASYIFYDENTAGRSVTRDDLPEFDDNIKTYFFGGISLISGPCASTYEALMAREAEHSLIMLDPNIRPALVNDEDDYRRRLDQMIEYVDIIKMSDEDLSWVFQDSTEEDAIKKLMKKDVSVVLVTKGASGASLYSGDLRIDVTPPKVKIVDTVGAGDTFNAGFLSWLSQHNKATKQAIRTMSVADMKSALERAVFISSHVVERQGANPPWDYELDLSTIPKID
jgi:fructokinase